MKLPSDSVIAREKATHYLLIPQARDDKSAFLARAGYRADDPDRLLTDLREQVLPLDATPTGSDKFGQTFEIRAALRGPNGATLAVRTFWMTEHLSSVTKFVTLLPDRRTGNR